MSKKRPVRPGDPRPGGKPYYIGSVCDECKTPLVLADLLDNPETPENKIWYDEWQCPRCNGAIYLDWPQSEMDDFIAETKGVTRQAKN